MTQAKHATLVSTKGDPMMLQGIKATGDLRGLLLTMSLVQKFINTSNKHAEVVYTFPLPWGAVLLGVDVKLGDQHLSGIVVEKNQAETQYEEALSVGDAAILLQVNMDRSYSLNLGNLAPQEQCCITLRYSQTLRFMQHNGQTALRLLLPTVIAPHYGESIQTGLQTLYTAEHDLLADYPFDIDLRLHGELAHARVTSPSHPIGVVFSEQLLNVNLGRRGALDRDFVLIVDQLKGHSTCILATDYANPNNIAVLASFCPQLPNLKRVDVTAKILVDCSGSMNGDSIESAKLALTEIIQQLRPEDRFSLSSFGNTVRHRSRAVWKCSDASRHAAKRWISSLRADMGGTEMEAALKSTFSLGSTTRGDVLLITDGQITDISTLITTAIESRQRVFIVGIGSAVSQANLYRLAEATGGAADFLAPGEDVTPAVLRMFARLRSPTVNSLRLEWSATTELVWGSSLPSALFVGDTVNLFIVLPEKPRKNLRVMGKLIGEEAEIEIACLSLDTEIDLDTNISRMGAACVIQSELSLPLVPATCKQTMALEYQLISPTTSFILTHVRAEVDRPIDMPDLHKVKHSVPAGWSGVGRVMFSRSIQMEYAIAPTEFDGLSHPAVWRRESNPFVVRASEMNLGHHNIPAFLRKSNDDYIQPQVSDQGCSYDPHYQGLTPTDLVRWLKDHHWVDWPVNFDSLLRIGVGVAVIDWLELVACTKDHKHLSQQVVMGTFLKWIVKNEAATQSASSNWLVTFTRFVTLNDKTKKMEKEVASLYYDPDLEIKLDLLLINLKKNQWPDAMFALDVEVNSVRENVDVA